MITTSIGFVALILLTVGVVLFVEREYKSKFFKYIPSLIVAYVLVMAMSTFGVWEMNPEIDGARKYLLKNLVPAMIVLMCLKCDIRQLKHLGMKMTATFLAGSLSIGIAFVVVYKMFKGFYIEGTDRAFAALAGAWMGSAQNLMAIKDALEVPGDSMTYTLLMANFDYSLWIAFLIFIGGFAPLFNKWVKADTSVIDEVGRKINLGKVEKAAPQFIDILIVIGGSLLVSAFSQFISTKLPVIGFFNASIWNILIVTAIGLTIGMTRLSKLRGVDEISPIYLYTVLMMMGANVDLKLLSNAPMYIATGLVILLIHGVIMVGYAKLFKVDLHTCAIASIANIGGVTSAPVIAGTYNDFLIPISILMSMLGSVLGTFGGLIVFKLLTL
jgi:uncharacterized membrane protein